MSTGTAASTLPIQLQTMDEEDKKKMPATSQKQQRLMAIAEHDPSKLFKRNRGVLDMTHQQLHDFAATKRSGLPVRAGQRIVRKKK